MEILNHGEYLTQLTRYPKFFPVSCYLVRDDDGLILIDAGLPGSEKEILAAAKDLGKPITRIVLTHAHQDHVGSLDALAAALPNAEILMGARESRIFAGDLTIDPSEPQTPPKGGITPSKLTPARLLSEGDRVGPLEVIATPGHTPGHLALFDTRDRSLIGGDSFQVVGGVAVSGTLRPIFPFMYFTTWHKPSALESARKIQALKPSRLAVGHGAVLENPEAAIRKAIADAERSLGKQATHGA
ncbi:MBL fold metallo-hydrolase [Capsulimonas corticalis]|uniref:MBL fold metallo-hydrolase n=1 Tax=Capsulimonas corticalis TaxID=2219043 RepID=A0A402D4P8_9BACT|nr:MBL fold metallo-hydrolase [Capsulimonas corticalis]BDI29259.1 MBL fold metallo-hydrolase [Capsulimonas corticalis]